MLKVGIIKCHLIQYLKNKTLLQKQVINKLLLILKIKPMI